MEILSKLSPAEIKFILSKGASSFDTLLECTFCDLILKRVIQVKKHEKNSDTQDQILQSTYVVQGSEFENYISKPHEDVLLKPLKIDKYLKIKFKHFVQLVFNEAHVNTDYMADLIQSDDLKPFYKQSYVFRMFNKYPLNKAGKHLQSELKAHFDKIDSLINIDINHGRNEAIKTIVKLKGHVFLLKNLNYDQLLFRFEPDILNTFSKNMFPYSPVVYFENSSSNYYSKFTDIPVLRMAFEFECDTIRRSLKKTRDFLTDIDLDFSCSGCGGGCGGCGN